MKPRPRALASWHPPRVSIRLTPFSSEPHDEAERIEEFGGKFASCSQVSTPNRRATSINADASQRRYAAHEPGSKIRKLGFKCTVRPSIWSRILRSQWPPKLQIDDQTVNFSINLCA